MPPKKPEDRDSLARTVDRLLKKLPGADPTLRSDPDAPPPRTPRPGGLGGVGGTGTTGPRPAYPRGPSGTRTTPAQLWGLWGWVAGGVMLGVGLTQWPYRTGCGWPLLGYLAAVTMLFVVAGWAAITAWHLRAAAAHVLALLVGFGGVVLVAQQVLPRVGYAAESATWRCRPARAGGATDLRSPPRAAPTSAVAPDSLAAVMPADSQRPAGPPVRPAAGR